MSSSVQTQMSAPLPRLRRAFHFDHASFGVDGPPRDFIFRDCVLIDDPKLIVQLTYYDKSPEEHPDEAPLYKREVEVSSKVGVTFSTFWHENRRMSEKVADRGTDERVTWCLGLAGVKGVDYVRLRIMDA